MGNNKTTDIFIYGHKEFKPIVRNPIYKILTCCDAQFKGNGLRVYRDYDGDNISEKNLMYNEYTGLYWIWKNYKLKKYVGLNHYRRIYSWCDNIPDMDIMFENFDMVINKPVDFNSFDIPDEAKVNNETWYKFWHNIEDFDRLEELFKTYYPEYMDGFEKMRNANYCYNSSMFIMKKEDFYKYCEFIFDVLEKYCDMIGLHSDEEYREYVSNNKDKYIKPNLPYYDVEMQSRIIGYVAERAMNAYIMHGGENSLEAKAAVVDWSMIPPEMYEVNNNNNETETNESKD